MDITLALGSGGVSGFAHLGVIRVLRRAGFRIHGLAGSSIGGLIGVLYSAGVGPDELEANLLSLDQRTFYRRSPDDGPGLLGLKGVESALRAVLGDRRLEELRIPVAVTAVDVDSGELLALREGAALEAVLATIAIPGVFPPQVWNGRRLMDGGVLDPVPVQLARALAPELPVVAVPLSLPMSAWEPRPPPGFIPKIPLVSGWLARSRYVQSLKIYLRGMDMTRCWMTDLQLERSQPEVIIRPQTHHVGMLAQFAPSELSALGEQAAELALPALYDQIRLHRRLTRRVRSWIAPESAVHLGA